MNKILLIPSALALSLLTGPALAQNFYGVHHYGSHNFTITGAQMTDWPSGRFNMTQNTSGSFLRPGHFGDHARHAEYRRNQKYYDRDYDGRRTSDDMDRDR